MVEYFKLEVTKYDGDMIPQEYIVFVKKDYMTKWLADNFHNQDTEVTVSEIVPMSFSDNENVDWIKIKK